MKKTSKVKIIRICIVALILAIIGVIAFVATHRNDKSMQITSIVTTAPVATTASTVPTTTADNIRIVCDKEEGGVVFLRAKASTEGKELDKIATGTKVTLLGEEGGWSKITVNGKTGYMKSSFLMTEEDYKAMNETTKKETKKTAKSSHKGKGRVICIDAGHQAKQNTGKEPLGPGSKKMKQKVTSGTSGVSTGKEEYKLNLEVAKKLQKALEKSGYKVVMCRESNNVNMTNMERAEVANQNNADAFIRIHANSSESSGKEGVMTICPTSNSPYCADIASQSYELAADILDSVVKETGAEKDKLWQTDTMSGINWSEVPVTILEMGYMSNPSEDEKLSSKDYQNKIVEGILDGLDTYFNS
ncbi:MAG: N-acetylmuramoyl-L-alanine amidase [Eubacterium sp.]|nr:N-acetylmuramoyl-L-alanine amidase [Eubacterium sp.]